MTDWDSAGNKRTKGVSGPSSMAIVGAQWTIRLYSASVSNARYAPAFIRHSWNPAENRPMFRVWKTLDRDESANHHIITAISLKRWKSPASAEDQEGREARFQQWGHDQVLPALFRRTPGSQYRPPEDFFARLTNSRRYRSFRSFAYALPPLRS
jgi:hypothetical protein